MPTYGYRCSDCGVTFERVQRMTDPALTECDSCGGTVKRLLYPVGISFKGTGFYVTDYKDSGKDPKAPAEKTETKAETTPPATTESKSASSESTTSATPAAAPAKTESTPSASS